MPETDRALQRRWWRGALASAVLIGALAFMAPALLPAGATLAVIVLGWRWWRRADYRLVVDDHGIHVSGVFVTRLAPWSHVTDIIPAGRHVRVRATGGPGLHIRADYGQDAAALAALLREHRPPPEG